MTFNSLACEGPGLDNRRAFKGEMTLSLYSFHDFDSDEGKGKGTKRGEWKG